MGKSTNDATSKVAQVATAKKKCAVCKRTKPAKAFNRNSAKADGLQTWCRDCHNESSRNRKAELEKFYLQFPGARQYDMMSLAEAARNIEGATAAVLEKELRSGTLAGVNVGTASQNAWRLPIHPDGYAFHPSDLAQQLEVETETVEADDTIDDTDEPSKGEPEQEGAPFTIHFPRYDTPVPDFIDLQKRSRLAHRIGYLEGVALGIDHGRIREAMDRGIAALREELGI